VVVGISCVFWSDSKKRALMKGRGGMYIKGLTTIGEGKGLKEEGWKIRGALR
jgi:hypothetical protein